MSCILFAENMEFVDDQLTFEELGNHLKSSGCHVANMSSLDFSAKNGIGGCLTRLLRKFLKVTLDVSPLYYIHAAKDSLATIYTLEFLTFVFIE